MKRLASVSEKKIYVMRWALLKAIDLHDQFFGEGWWKNMRLSEIRKINRTRQHLMLALEIFDETWKIKLDKLYDF